MNISSKLILCKWLMGFAAGYGIAYGAYGVYLIVQLIRERRELIRFMREQVRRHSEE